jgi:LemA protein
VKTLDTSYLLVGLAGLAALLLLFLWKTYNGLVRLRNSLRAAWSDIDVQLGRRHDLVPNLVEAVKGYMSHERSTLEAVTEARARAMQGGADIATRAVAEMALGSALGSVLASAERYPQLKASENFLLLQEQIASTENRIAFARQHFNETVRRFNTAIAEFPKNIVANSLGFRPEQMFVAEAGERETVAVRLRSSA